MPERNIKKTMPKSPRILISGSPAATQAKPLRPTTIPARISPTMIGIATRLNRESNIGTVNAISNTMRSGRNECAAFIRTLPSAQKATRFFLKHQEGEIFSSRMILGTDSIIDESVVNLNERPTLDKTDAEATHQRLRRQQQHQNIQKERHA
jgi:hypothetical protein